MEVVYGILGRLHPLLTHLPIGFLMLCILLFLKDRKTQQYTELLTTLVLWTGIAGVFACSSGYLLYLYEGYSYMTMRNHLWLGMLTTGFCFLVYGRRKSGGHSDLRYIPLGLFLFIGFVLITVTGHLGGNLSRGSNYLTEPLPPFLKKRLGMPVFEKLPLTLSSDAWRTAGFYDELIHPLLNNKCVSCHGPEKAKGGLRLDNKTGILAGGENGNLLSNPSTKKGELIHRITLPEKDEGHMPPEGREELTKSEIALLEAWIDLGYPFEGTIDELKPDMAVLAPFISTDAAEFYPVASPPKVSEAQKDSIRKAGLHVESLSADSPFLVISAVNKPDFSVSDTLLLLPVAAAIAELDLSHTQVDSTLYGFLGRLPNLTVLNLAHTAVNEVGIEQLENLSNLKRLNLTFTQVGPDVIPKLERIANLNTVYLFGTTIIQDSITPPGRESLKLEFGGFSLPALESDFKIY